MLSKTPGLQVDKREKGKKAKKKRQRKVLYLLLWQVGVRRRPRFPRDYIPSWRTNANQPKQARRDEKGQSEARIELCGVTCVEGTKLLPKVEVL